MIRREWMGNIAAVLCLTPLCRTLLHLDFRTITIRRLAQASPAGPASREYAPRACLVEHGRALMPDERQRQVEARMVTPVSLCEQEPGWS